MFPISLRFQYVHHCCHLWVSLHNAENCWSIPVSCVVFILSSLSFLLEYYMTQKLFLKLTAETFWAFIVITKIFIGYKLVLQTSTFINQSQIAYYWLLWSLIHQQKWRTLVTIRKQQVNWTVRERCLLFKIMGGEGIRIPKMTNNLTSPYFLSSCIYV